MPNRAKKPRNRGRLSAQCAKGGSITARWESWVFLDPAFADSGDALERDDYRKASISIGLEKDF